MSPVARKSGEAIPVLRHFSITSEKNCRGTRMVDGRASAAPSHRKLHTQLAAV